MMTSDIKTVKKDRLRYTKNKLSSTLAYVGILFNVLYFVNIYGSDVGNFYYTTMIGLSVVYNLIFLLSAFLSSEGVKNYKFGYSCFIIGIGVLQIARIFGIPRMAHSTTLLLDGVETVVMPNSQFTYVVVCLAISAAACIASGIIGVYKYRVLTAYEKSIGIA